MDEDLKPVLKEAIAYALGRSLPLRGAWKGLEPTQIAIAAEAVIRQLELSGFTVVRSGRDYRGSFAAR